MTGGRFTLDTNVLVYSVDRSAGSKHDIAKSVMSKASVGSCILTLQCLSEFYVVVTRKRMMPHVDASRYVTSAMTVFPTCPPSAESIRIAMRMAVAGQASYWDALLLATAAEAGCGAILTEDLADGSVLAGVRIINPFGDAGLTGAALSVLA